MPIPRRREGMSNRIEEEDMEPVRIGLIGERDPTVISHQAIPEALRLAGQEEDTPVAGEWVGTRLIELEPAVVSGFDGLWCVPNSPYRSLAGALSAIRFARETPLPFLGTCGGFQHALLEYARNVLGLHAAGHSEIDPDTDLPFITPLRCALVEQTGQVFFSSDSALRTIYGVQQAQEGYHCSYGLHSEHEPILSNSGLRFGARDLQGEVRAVELIGHPFYICTLYQPERRALKGKHHPLVTAFVQAAREQRDARRMLNG